MLKNVRSAAEAAHFHGALGLLLTDWGDGGHPQVLPVSYPAYTLAASLAWSSDGLTDDELCQALDTYIYKDVAHVMGRFALELGRFNRFEEFILPCRTQASFVAGAGLIDKDAWEQRLAGIVNSLAMFLEPRLLEIYQAHYENRRVFDYEGLLGFLDARQTELDSSAMTGGDGKLIKREYAHTIAVLRLLADTHAYIVFGNEWQETRKSAFLSSLAQTADAVAKEHEEIWNIRNKSFGVSECQRQYENIREQSLQILNQGE